MAKKKENPPVEEKKTGEAEKAANTAAENEIPESVTLTRDEFKQVKERIDQLEKEKESDVALLQRLQADFDNYRRRTRQEQCDLSAFVTQNLIKDLLPVVDNFERALASRPTEDPSGFGAGVEMIYRQFYAVLEKQGISAVETVGAMFDPAKHEAIMKDEDSDQPEGTVVAELQKGYAACGKIIRPALVKVAGK